MSTEMRALIDLVENFSSGIIKIDLSRTAYDPKDPDALNAEIIEKFASGAYNDFELALEVDIDQKTVRFDDWSLPYNVPVAKIIKKEGVIFAFVLYQDKDEIGDYTEAEAALIRNFNLPMTFKETVVQVITQNIIHGLYEN